MIEVISFDQAIKETQGQKRNLLLGNGFSIAQSGNDFTYNNLLEESDINEGTDIRNVFIQFETTDFEEVMSHLNMQHKLKKLMAMLNAQNILQMMQLPFVKL